MIPSFIVKSIIRTFLLVCEETRPPFLFIMRRNSPYSPPLDYTVKQYDYCYYFCLGEGGRGILGEGAGRGKKMAI